MVKWLDNIYYLFVIYSSIFSNLIIGAAGVFLTTVNMKFIMHIIFIQLKPANMIR